MIAVSKCLAGYPCRYDGGAKTIEEFVSMEKSGHAICVCPECLGGLPVPRPPCEIVGGDGADVLAGRARVMDVNGRDCSEAFIRGAQETLRILKERHIESAVLKARSPSCGMGEIYDGSFSGRTKTGNGVTAALLLENKIKVETR